MIKAATAPRIPQDSRLSTTFGGRKPEDGKIMWEWSTAAIYNLIRAVTHPYPGAFTFHRDRKLYLWSARLVDGRAAVSGGAIPGTIETVEKGRGIVISTGEGRLLATRVQFEGEEEIAADVLPERYGIPVGTRLG